jgi:CBS domain containing-hemolysin-like protein
MMPSLFILLGALTASAFFSGMEIAFLSANRLQVEIEAKKGSVSGRLMPWFYRHSSSFIATMLLGNTLALVLVGNATAKLLNGPLDFLGSPFAVMAVQTLLSTVVVLVLAEYMPKAFFRERANESLQAFTVLLALVLVVFSPAVLFFTVLSRWVTRLTGHVGESRGLGVFGRADLDHLVGEHVTDSVGPVEPEVALFRNALEFADVRVRACMVPRNAIEAIAVGTELEALRERFVATGYSKLVVFRETIDDAFAYVHAHALFQKPKSLVSALTPVAFLPETLLAHEAFRQLVASRRSLALVVDEFGTLVGMVTLEDLTEELFGEIDDEHDTEDLIERQISDHEFLFSARLEVSHLNDSYRLNLPESEAYNTLGGLFIDRLGRLPSVGESVRMGDWNLIAAAVKSNRIEEIRVKG